MNPNPPVFPGTDWVPPLPPVPDCPRGLEYLTEVNQILIHQQLEFLEIIVGFETNNKYTIRNPLGQMIYFAAEENDCCTLSCCGSCRPFTMKLFDNTGQQVIELLRPCRCCICCCYCCLQELEVHAPPGTPIGYVKQIWDPCVPIFAVQNEARKDILKITGPIVGCGCCTDVLFHAMSLDEGHTVGRIMKHCEGLVKECCIDADSFCVQFPVDLDVKMKAAMIGAWFLIDFMFFEDGEPIFLCTWCC